MGRADGVAGGGVVFREEGVRDAVREAAVGGVVDTVDVQRRTSGLEGGGDGVEGRPGGPVVGIGNDAEGREGSAVDEGKDPVDVNRAGIGRQDAARVDLARRGGASTRA